VKIAALTTAHVGHDATGPVVGIGGALWDSDLHDEPGLEPFGWIDEDGTWVAGVPYQQMLRLEGGRLVEATAALEHGITDRDLRGAPDWGAVRYHVEGVLMSTDVVAVLDPRGAHMGIRRLRELEWSGDVLRLFDIDQGRVLEVHHSCSGVLSDAYYRDRPLLRLARRLGIGVVDYYSLGARATTALRCLVEACGPGLAEDEDVLAELAELSQKTDKVGKVGPYGRTEDLVVPPLLEVNEKGHIIVSRVYPGRQLWYVTARHRDRMIRVGQPTTIEKKTLGMLTPRAKWRARGVAFRNAVAFFKANLPSSDS